MMFPVFILPNKNLGCDGDGGMVLTDDENIAHVRSLKVHGSGKDELWMPKRNRNERIAYPENMPVGESKYYNYLIGCITS